MNLLWNQLAYLLVILISNLKFLTVFAFAVGKETPGAAIDFIGPRRPPPFVSGPGVSSRNTAVLKRARRSPGNFFSEDVAGGGVHGSNGPWPLSSNGSNNGPTFGVGREVLLFRLAASGLPNLDPFGGKPDPFIQISYANHSSNKYENFGRTATLSDTVEARWSEIIKFEHYMRGGQQKLQFEVRDHDPHTWDDRIGFAYIDVDSCVTESRPKPTYDFFVNSADKNLFSSCSAQITDENGELLMMIL